MPESQKIVTGEATLLERVLDAPQKYINEEIIVEGVLQSYGKGINPRFFLQSKEGKTLEVSPWAPLEIYHPPSSQKGGTTLRPMSYFVGRRLRLTGRLQKEGERYILKVSSAGEL